MDYVDIESFEKTSVAGYWRQHVDVPSSLRYRRRNECYPTASPNSWSKSVRHIIQTITYRPSRRLMSTGERVVEEESRECVVASAQVAENARTPREEQRNALRLPTTIFLPVSLFVFLHLAPFFDHAKSQGACGRNVDRTSSAGCRLGWDRQFRAAPESDHEAGACVAGEHRL